MRIKRAAVLVLGMAIMLSAVTVYAEGEVTEKTKDSKAIITFEEGDGGGTDPGEGGPLQIKSVSDFVFKGEISEDTRTYNVQTASTNVQVLDLRGKGTGWTLDAKVEPFIDGDESEALQGSALLIKDGRLVSNTADEYAPEAEQNVRLTTDGTPERILTAKPGTGIGLWTDYFHSENIEEDPYVQLEVPPTLIKVDTTYTAEITWILKSTPQ